MKRTGSLIVKGIFASLIILTFSPTCPAAIDASSFVEKFDSPGGQTVFSGIIDSLVIDEGALKFILGPGKISLFEFGQDIPCAMTYRGYGRLTYYPPNEPERYQLYKFTDYDSLDNTFQKAVFFYTGSIEGFPVKSALMREAAPGDASGNIKDAANDAFQHLGIYLPNELLVGLLSEKPRRYIYADLDLDRVGHLAFEEDPMVDDQYRLYHIKRSAGAKTFDILAGYSADNLLPSERGVKNIDIYHYDIIADIEAGGKMNVTCGIYYVPLTTGNRFIYLDWYYDIEIKSAADKNGLELRTVSKKEGAKLFGIAQEESGLGIVLNEPTVAGESSYVSIRYDSKCLEKYSTLYFIKTRTFWYPHNRARDLATYSLTFKCPKKYEVISCGEKISDNEGSSERVTRYNLDYPSEYIAFNVGSYRKKQVELDNGLTVDISLAKEIADASYGGVPDRFNNTRIDVTNSLTFFSSIFGPPPFDYLYATSKPSGGLSSPGLIFLDWDTFLDEDMEGYYESLRAHEVSHQWWGDIVDYESYRDRWIIEGLAEYCGLWYYEMSQQDKGSVARMMEDYRNWITSGTGMGSKGTVAGPPIMGSRLSSTQSEDESSIIYDKGAYIFHMIRYLLHDYKTGSDDRFAMFLKDLLMKYSHRPITTQGLQELLERHIGGDMSWFFNQWVYGIDIPKYSFSFEATKNDDKKYKVKCFVKQKDVPDDFKMIVPLTVIFDSDRYIHMRIWVTGPETVADLPLLPYKPKKIVFNSFDAVLAR